MNESLVAPRFLLRSTSSDPSYQTKLPSRQNSRRDGSTGPKSSKMLLCFVVTCVEIAMAIDRCVVSYQFFRTSGAFGAGRWSEIRSRRSFLRTAGTIPASLTILKAGSARTYAANERLNIASVGAGGKAAGDIRNVASENIVALCDVDWERAADSFERFPKARRYKDYRVMLSELDAEIDAVIVATPDHHHFHASMAAIRRGKHVYCEKPLTHSVWEARELTKAARAEGVATQMGNQAQASEETRVLQEFVLDDAVGKIREAHIWTDRPAKGLFGEYWPQGIARPTETPKVPAALDWDLWLGPAPSRPYHPIYAPRQWRGWWDFGTGALGDIACHFFDPVFRALKLGPPASVEATSTRVNEETYPLGSMIYLPVPRSRRNARGAIGVVRRRVDGRRGRMSPSMAMSWAPTA